MDNILQEIFINCYTHLCDNDERVVIYNTYIDGCGHGTHIYDNHKDFFKENFQSEEEANKAISNGKYCEFNDYVWFNDKGIIMSGDVPEDIITNKEIIKNMSEWFLTHYDDINIFGNMEEFIDACKYGVDVIDDED